MRAHHEICHGGRHFGLARVPCVSQHMFWIDGGPVFVIVSCNLFQRQYTRILTDTDRLTHRQTHKQLDIPRQRHRRTERHTQPDTDTGRHRQTHTEPHTLPHIQLRRACRNQFSMCSYLIVMIAMAGLKARPQDSNVLSCRYCLTQLKFKWVQYMWEVVFRTCVSHSCKQ